MKTYIGTGASTGIYYGKTLYLENRKQIARKDSEYEIELMRLSQALNESTAQIERLKSSSKTYLSEYELGIFDVQEQLLMDENIRKSIENTIKEENCNAEYAVEKVLDATLERLCKINDETVLTRIADIKDIFSRLIDNLLSEHEINAQKMNGSFIVVAEELLPSTALNMNLSRVGGIISKKGSEKGHLAIIARALNIPYVCNIEEDFEIFTENDNGIMAVVDGFEGKVILNPDENTKDFYVNKIARMFNENAIYTEMKGLENVAKDGRKIDILCNIGLAEEADAVILNDGNGVGLLRTEFLFMQGDSFPSEEKQFHYYSHIIKKMAGRKTVIRTLDIGEDKLPSYILDMDEFSHESVDRGVAFSLKNKDIFKTQIRAIYRAAVTNEEHGKVSILFPMVRTPEELKQCILLCDEVQKELKNSQILFNESVEKGIMVECALALKNIDELAELSDYFSIGTNDLLREFANQNKTQNICETGSENEQIIKMIKSAADAAHAQGIKVSICGELASDIDFMEQFLDIGIDELSVNPSDVLKLRYKIRSL